MSKGHRERLRERFNATNGQDLSESELLELLLTYSIPRKDVKPLAESLLNKFNSLENIFSASKAEWQSVSGLGPASNTLFGLFQVIYQRLQSSIPTQISQPIDIEKPRKLVQDKLFESSKESLINPELNFGYEETGVKPDVSKNKDIRRKFQVSNGYLLEFDQLAKVLNHLAENTSMKKISRAELMEHTGLSNRQLESLVSIGSAMGLIVPGKQVLSETGKTITKHDIFFEDKGTLEWCHYQGAGSFKNLIWFEIFNTVLPNDQSLTQDGWNETLRQALAGQYTDRTIGKHLYEEVRLVVEAYLEGNFRKLELIQQTSNDKLHRRRYFNFAPLVLCAIIYDYCESQDTKLLQINELSAVPGSPAILFGLDDDSFGQQLETLHNKGWLRYETTHNLNQIRLKPDLTSIELLRAYYEKREPDADVGGFLSGR